MFAIIIFVATILSIVLVDRFFDPDKHQDRGWKERYTIALFKGIIAAGIIFTLTHLFGIPHGS